MSEYEGRHARPRQPGPAAARLRALWAGLQLRLAWWEWPLVQAHWYRQFKRADRKAFLAECAAMTPAPAGRPVQAVPRPADRHAVEGAARCGPGQPLPEQPHLPGCDGQCGGLAAHQAHLDDGGCPCCYCAQYAVPQAPGAVADGTGTDAGGAPPPAAAATTPPGGAATLPPPAPPRDYPGRGQHPERKAWVTYAGDHPMPGYRGDYRPTQPMRAAGGTVACNIFRPYYPELERWRDSTRRTA